MQSIEKDCDVKIKRTPLRGEFFFYEKQKALLCRKAEVARGGSAPWIQHCSYKAGYNIRHDFAKFRNFFVVAAFNQRDKR